MMAVFSSGKSQITVDLHLAMGSDIDFETCWSALGNKSRVISWLVHGFNFWWLIWVKWGRLMMRKVLNWIGTKYMLVSDGKGRFVGWNLVLNTIAKTWQLFDEEDPTRASVTFQDTDGLSLLVRKFGDAQEVTPQLVAYLAYWTWRPAAVSPLRLTKIVSLKGFLRTSS